MSGSLSPKPVVDASDDRGHLLTEQSNPRSGQLDTLPVADPVDLFISEDVQPQPAVAAAAARVESDAAAAPLAEARSLVVVETISMSSSIEARRAEDLEVTDEDDAWGDRGLFRLAC